MAFKSSRKEVELGPLSRTLLGECQGVVVSVSDKLPDTPLHIVVKAQRLNVSDTIDSYWTDHHGTEDRTVSFSNEYVQEWTDHIQGSDNCIILCRVTAPLNSSVNIGDEVMLTPFPFMDKLKGSRHECIFLGDKLRMLRPQNTMTFAKCISFFSTAMRQLLNFPPGPAVYKYIVETERGMWEGFLVALREGYLDGISSTEVEALHSCVSGLLDGLVRCSLPTCALSLAYDIVTYCHQSSSMTTSPHITWAEGLYSTCMTAAKDVDYPAPQYYRWQDLQPDHNAIHSMVTSFFGSDESSDHGGGSSPANVIDHIRVIGITLQGSLEITCPHQNANALLVLGVRTSVQTKEWSLYWFESIDAQQGLLRLAAPGRPREVATFLQMSLFVQSDESVRAMLLDHGSDGLRQQVVREKSHTALKFHDSQKHIDAQAADPEELRQMVLKCLQGEDTSCTLLGSSGTGKTEIASKVILALHSEQVGSVRQQSLPHLMQLQNAIKEFSAALSTNKVGKDLVDLYRVVTSCISDVSRTQQQASKIIVSDQKPRAVHMAQRIGSQGSGIEMGTMADDTPFVFRSGLLELLNRIGATSWYCSDERRFPMYCLLVAASQHERDTFGTLNQKSVDGWASTVTEPCRLPHEGLHVIPPARKGYKSGDHASRPLWDLSEVEREDKIQEYREKTLAMLGTWYDETLMRLKLAAAAAQELKCDKSQLVKISTSSTFPVLSFSELSAPNVRTMLSVLKPSTVIVEDSGDFPLATLGSYLSGFVSHVIICSRRLHPTHSVFHLQQQYRHSDEVRTFLRLLKKNEGGAHQQDYEFVSQLVSSRRKCGIQSSTFLWTCASYHVETLVQMALGIGRHVLQSNAFRSVAIVVSNPSEIGKFKCLQEEFPSCLVTSAEMFIGQEAECVVVLVTTPSFTLQDLVNVVDCAKTNVYSVAWSRWVKSNLPSSFYSTATTPQVCGPCINLRCEKHGAQHQLFVEYNVEGSNVECIVSVPEYGKWCPMICGQRYQCKQSTTTSPHLCGQLCCACDGNHSVCVYPCERIFSCTHACTKDCAEPCGECAQQTIAQSTCEGTKLLIGYDVGTRQGKYRTFAHYQDVVCGQPTAPCKELVVKFCDGCHAEVPSMVCCEASPQRCSQCHKYGPLARSIIKETNQLIERQRALRVHRARENEGLEEEKKREEQWLALRRKYTLSAATAAQERQSKLQQAQRTLFQKHDAAKKEFEENANFIKTFVSKTYEQQCSLVERLSLT